MTQEAAIFFDLQGTLGGKPLGDILDFSFYPGALEALATAHRHAFLCFVITNQSHISKGLLTQEQFWERMDALEKMLEVAGGRLTKTYCCPHLRAEGCHCKKPSPYFLQEAIEQYHLAAENCYMVGDIGASDMLLAKNAGVMGVLVRTGEGERSLGEQRNTWADYTPAYVAEDVLSAVSWIAAQAGR